ncbi:MAG TPA: fluoride efflux transporter CrcB [Marinobacterium sp.]|nr:fluoride efflux transporter CrcB [Marinobacterium sp.]
MHIISVALGGALGALARYWLSGWLNSGDAKLPWGTLSANVLGSLLMGVAFVLILEKAKLAPEMRPLLMTGFLGAFTTFSTFSLETLTLIHEGHIITALFYVLLSVILCIAALALAVSLTRML